MDERDCPVAPLVAEARTLANAYRQIEARIDWGKADQAGRSVAWDLLRNKLSANYEMQTAVETHASVLAAKSALGALFQLALIKTEAEKIEQLAGHFDQRLAGQGLEKIERMVWSIANFIEAATGVKFSDAHGEWYMYQDSNPHLELDDLEAFGAAKMAVGL
jgi:hypothetical protein